jgi:hypothetical protein
MLRLWQAFSDIHHLCTIPSRSEMSADVPETASEQAILFAGVRRLGSFCKQGSTSEADVAFSSSTSSILSSGGSPS